MATIYIFANNTYATLEEARAAAATKIAELDRQKQIKEQELAISCGDITTFSTI